MLRVGASLRRVPHRAARLGSLAGARGGLAVHFAARLASHSLRRETPAQHGRADLRRQVRPNPL